MEPTPVTLVDDSVLNVAQLLKENVGSKRIVILSLQELQLDEQIQATDVEARIKLTRIVGAILATGDVRGRAIVECVRCLEEFETAYSGEIEAQFRPTVDIRSGVQVEPEDDGETFDIDEGHQLDLSELIRQVSILSLPIRPVCGENCPGFEPVHGEGDRTAETADERFAVLEKLLEDSRETG